MRVQDSFDLRGLGDCPFRLEPQRGPSFAHRLDAYGDLHVAVGNSFSRWRERLADQYALANTRNPDAFIAAMTRLANQNLAEVEPEPWVEFLLYSHPSIGKRIAMARAFAPRSLDR